MGDCLKFVDGKAEIVEYKANMIVTSVTDGSQGAQDRTGTYLSSDSQ